MRPNPHYVVLEVVIMQFHNITKDDMLNGDGLRVVLWVAGCSHYCKECQNPVTWDPNGGVPFTEAAKQEIFDELWPERSARNIRKRPSGCIPVTIGIM
jgi:pyruvate-formate lyase-activating enzyme